MNLSEAIQWLENAEADYHAAKREKRSGLISQEDFDAAKAELKSARDEVKNLKQ